MNFTSLDREFSLRVRERSGWICALCGEDYSDRPEELHCSHFHHRVHHSVRFDFDNCDAFCWQCHHRMEMHHAEYSEWKAMQLGEDRFEALSLRAHKIEKLDRKTVRTNIRNFNLQAA
jgi:hypothetical protein